MKNLEFKKGILMLLVAAFAALFTACESTGETASEEEDLMAGQPEGVVEVWKLLDPISGFEYYYAPVNADAKLHGNFEYVIQGLLDGVLRTSAEIGFNNGEIIYIKKYSQGEIDFNIVCKNGKLVEIVEKKKYSTYSPNDDYCTTKGQPIVNMELIYNLIYDAMAEREGI